MTSIVQIGMDVHKNNFTVCCFDIESEQVKYTVTLEPDYRQIIKYIQNVRKRYPEGTEFECGYEAGCLGYSLYNDLTSHGVKCTILAPTTMSEHDNKIIKTDKRDAANIAKCLAYHTYKKVYILDDEDNSVKEYIRMRDDHSKEWKRIKQQILALCLRNGSVYHDGDHWTLKHITWLNHLTFKNAVLQETFEEYLSTFNYLKDKLERLDKRIEEFSQKEKYIEKVKRLSCLLGIKEHTALSLVVEVGDYNRFPKAKSFSAFLGLVPGEHTSDKNRNILSITKAGNTHLRRLLVEAAQCYPKGKIGYKSAALKKRQQGSPPKVIAYADKANERLRRKAYHLILGENKKRNIAVVAIARELACFVWGMMTDHVD